MGSVPAAMVQDVEIYRQEIQAAINRAAELRALHAALLPSGRSGSSSALRLSDGAASPCRSRTSRQFSSTEYPVFAPSYEEEPIPAYFYLRPGSESFLETSTRTGPQRDDEISKPYASDDDHEIKNSAEFEHRLFSDTDGRHTLCRNHVGLSEQFSGTGWSDSQDIKPVIACNGCRPAGIRRAVVCEEKSCRETIVASDARDTYRRSCLPSHQNKVGAVLSKLFTRLGRKPRSKVSPKALESEIYKPGTAMDADHVGSIERVTTELIGAAQSRDAALAEIGEMRSTCQELRDKLARLEAHCRELRTALKQEPQGKHARCTEGDKSTSGDWPMPVSHEVMLEGFLQIAAEAGLSVAQFCKTLITLSDEADQRGSVIGSLIAHVGPSSSSTLMSCKGSKVLHCHLESLVNHALFEDFENCAFQRNGVQKVLDPREHCLENFSAFVALRSLSWKEALTKGSPGYSEDLRRFCDRKMSSAISLLDKLGLSWPEQLCHAFFVAAKCIWLLHLLAFSFGPPSVKILRVERNRSFDHFYMENVLPQRQRRRAQVQAQARVLVMVMPGFYVQDRMVIRCKVVCS